MKICKRLIAISLAVLLAFSLCGCGDFIQIELLGMDPTLVAYQKDPAAFVVFFPEEGSQEEQIVSLEEIMAYESQYPECNSTWYRDQLTGESLAIYNSLLYGMEHNLGYICLYVADAEETNHWYIRELLSLDSPFLAQNAAEDEGWGSWEPEPFGQRIYFEIPQFRSAEWEKKMQALEICRQVVAQMPEELATQEEKMEYLYHYVCDHVTYTEMDTKQAHNYLYDAVCEGETLCDGYSNMLMLLFRLAGVECCEVMGVALVEEEAEVDDGHTWVAAILEGQYYYFDATYEDTAEGWPEEDMYFGFSEKLLDTDQLDYEEYTPQCTDTQRDLPFVHLTVDNITERQTIYEIADFTDSRTREEIYTTYVLVTQPVTESMVDTMLDIYIDRVEYISSVDTSYMEDFVGMALLRLTTEPW